MGQELKKNRKLIIQIVIFAVFVLASVIITVKLIPFFSGLMQVDSQEKFKEYIASLGISGFFVMIGIQILQIVIAFIPGEPVEIIAGIIYGTWGGLLICLLSVFIGSFIVFFAVRRFGYPLVTAFFNEEKLNKFKFLQDTKRLEHLAFLLFFVPGTPKDILTYIAGLTKINPWRFLLISTFARIPSIITSTMAGFSIREGEWLNALIVFLISGALAAGGIFLKEYLVRKHEKQKTKP